MVVVRNLRRRPWRSALTTGGVAIAFAAFLCIVSAARGINTQFRTLVEDMNSEITVQQTGVALPHLSRVTEAQVEALRRLPEVHRVSEVAIGITRLESNAHFLIFGARPETEFLTLLRLTEGRPMVEDQSELMIGRSASEWLGVVPGDRVELMGRAQFTVVAIFESGQGLLDNACVMDLSAAQRAFRLGSEVNLVFVKLRTGVETAEGLRTIAARVPDVTASPSELWVASFRQMEVVERFSYFLALVAVFVAVLGLANTLSMNVAERVGEVGLLRAIGWGRGRIARMVLAEGMLLTAIGASVGYPLALVLMRSIELSTSATRAAIPTAPDPVTVAQGAVLVVITGILGSLPALWMTLRMRPWNALRNS
jgi:putative ABC transport system permease protein